MLKSTGNFSNSEILTAFIGSGILFKAIGFSDVGSIILAIAVGIYYDTVARRTNG